MTTRWAPVRTGRGGLGARLAGEGGFGLIELVMAMLLAMALVAAFSGTLRGALSGSRENRFRQDATGIAMERIEAARSLDWEELALAAIDPDAPLIDQGSEILLASEADLPQNERLRVCASGALDPRRVETFQDIEFTTWTYVTQPSATLRRVFVLVEWNGENGMRSYRASTLISTVSAGTATATNGSSFPEAAIMATGNVNLHPGGTVGVPAGTHSAHVLTNANFGTSGAWVDGNIKAGGTVTVDPGSVEGLIEQNVGTVFDPPTEEEIEAWRADLLLQAQSGTILYGSQRFKDTTVTAPIYIDGSLVIEGTVTIEGSGPIYATGSIKLQGGPTVTTDSSFFVSDVLVEFSGGTTYAVNDYGSASPTAGGAISFGVNSKALKLTGSSSGFTQGVAYAPYGGVLLSGTSAWHGAIVAGGSNGLGVVEFSGGSWVEYPSNLVAASQVLQGLVPTPEPSVCP